jgi:hypothetical protein
MQAVLRLSLAITKVAHILQIEVTVVDDSPLDALERSIYMQKSAQFLV